MPAPVLMIYTRYAFRETLVSSVRHETICLSKCLRTEIFLVHRDRWAGGVAEAAHNAIAELEVLESVSLSLEVLSCRILLFFRVFSNQIRFHESVVCKEIVEVGREISDHIVVDEWLGPYRTWR